MPPFSASGDSAAPRVSITVTSGRPSSAASFIPRRASRSASGPIGCSAVWPRRSCPRKTHGACAEAHQRDQQPGVVLALARAVERDHVGGGVPQQPSYAGPVGAARAGDGVPRLDVGQRRERHRRRGDRADPVPGREQDRQRAVQDAGDLLGRQDGVDDAVGVEVLRGLHALGERLAVERLVDPRPEEADQGARARRPSRGRASPTTPSRRRWWGGAGRRGRAGRRPCAPRPPAVIRTICTNAGVPSCIRVPPLIGPASSGRPSRVARSIAATSRSADGPADRAGQEAELAHHDRHPPPVHQALAGEHRLVDAALLPRGGELGGVRLRDLAVRRAARPSELPGTLVEDQVDQLARRETGHPVRVRRSGAPRRAAGLLRGTQARACPRSARRVSKWTAVRSSSSRRSSSRSRPIRLARASSTSRR